MKGIIIYCTKTGTTKKCAEKIKEKTSFDCFNLKDKSFDKQSFMDYDFVVLGAPVRMGRVDKPMRKFLAKYGNYLLDKKLAVFGLGISPESRRSMYIIYDNLIDESVCAVMLGGELVTEGVKGLKRMFAESLLLQLTSGGAPAPSVDQSELDSFCQKILNPDAEISFKRDLKAGYEQEDEYAEVEPTLPEDYLNDGELEVLNGGEGENELNDLDKILGQKPIDEDDLDLEGGAK